MVPTATRPAVEPASPTTSPTVTRRPRSSPASPFSLPPTAHSPPANAKLHALPSCTQHASVTDVTATGSLSRRISFTCWTCPSHCTVITAGPDIIACPEIGTLTAGSRMSHTP